jgi:DNA-binding PadR family transcriptional regulator
VLDAIAAQPRHGYEIIQVIGERSGGSYRPSPGVIYPTLQMLEELGHARAVAREDRKVYAITEEGQRDLQEHAVEVAEFYEGYPDVPFDQYAEDLATLGKRIRRVVHLFKHAVHRGGIRPSTMRKARAVLDEALEKLEELLSRDGP